MVTGRNHTRRFACGTAFGLRHSQRRSGVTRRFWPVTERVERKVSFMNTAEGWGRVMLRNSSVTPEIGA
jgi:hypothetical protein